MREAPDSADAARVFGCTGRLDALVQLKKHLASPDPTVRRAAEGGCSWWYGNALDPSGFALFAELARNDPHPHVQLAARGTLEDVGRSVPWVKRAVDDLFEPLFDTDEHPPLSDMASLAARLWPVGPATRKAVAMLTAEPRLVRPELREPLSNLLNAAVAGEVGLELNMDVARFAGKSFRESALVAMAGDQLTPTGRVELAATLGMVYPDDADVFDLLVASTITTPSLLLEGVISLSRVPSARKIETLCSAIESLREHNREAIEMCVGAMRNILHGMSDDDRSTVRAMCNEATGRALALAAEREFDH
ncbi:hypothetical protein ACWEIJ_44560 [Lentzea sp. NPDC004789]